VAALGLTVSLALLARLMAGEQGRARLDAWCRQVLEAARARWQRLRTARHVRSEAELAARALIDRARQRAQVDVKREGNVYTPSSFETGGERKRPPRNPRKLH
jgi:hypothetical protein